MVLVAGEALLSYGCSDSQFPRVVVAVVSSGSSQAHEQQPSFHMTLTFDTFIDIDSQ
jgi:hypothetical protein